MKKFIAILLSCIMLFACIPFSASAAEVTWDQMETVASSVTIADGETFVITGVYTLTADLTIMKGGALVIEANGALVFTGSNAKLVNSGSVTIKRNGTLELQGTGTTTANATLINKETGTFAINNGAICTLGKNSHAYNYGNMMNLDRMDIKGKLTHQVTIPGNFDIDYSYVETWNRDDFTTTYSVSYYIPQQGDGDLDYTNADKYLPVAEEKTVGVIHGQRIYIMITPEEGVEGDWCDVGRMMLTAGGQNLSVTQGEQIANDRGVFCVSPANAIKLGVYSTSYKDLVKIFRITLPKTDAYYVISKDGDVEETTVEYGKMFSFRVVLSPEYDKSEYYAYVNTLYMEPDEYGYYDITGPIVAEGMSSVGGIQEDIEIQIMGVSSNESKEMMGSLVGFIQQIISVIEEMFSYFLDIFAGLGDGLGLGSSAE